MPFPHLFFTLINFAILIVVLFAERKNLKDYVFLGILGLVAAFVFETATTALGFWHYHSEPKIFIISIYTWLLYIPYLSFCYFIGNRLADKLGSSKIKRDKVGQSG